MTRPLTGLITTRDHGQRGLVLRYSIYLTTYPFS